jgi:hypothetical protein
VVVFDVKPFCMTTTFPLPVETFAGTAKSQEAKVEDNLS